MLKRNDGSTFYMKACTAIERAEYLINTRPGKILLVIATCYVWGSMIV